MGLLLFFDLHKMGQFVIFSKAKVHLFSSWYCNPHVQAPGVAVPTHIPAGQNFLPASALDSCQPCQKLVFEMDLQLGRQGHCFYTHMDLLNAKEMFLNWREKIPWHNYSFRSFPKTFGDRAGESTWLKEVKICSWWSEWDRLSAGMTADDGVIKHLP